MGAIVIPDLSGIGQGIQTAGSALAGALEKRAERRLEQKRYDVLNNVLEEADLETQAGQQEFLRKTAAAGIPMKESLGILDRAIKQQSASRQGFQVEDPERLHKLFTDLGVPRDQASSWANLYKNLSTGGRTSFANMLIDKMQRGEFGTPQQVDLDAMVGRPQPVAGVVQEGTPQEALGTPPLPLQEEQEQFVFPDVQLFEGLTPKEKVGREKDLFNENAKDFSEISQKSRGLRNEAVRVNQLERYNDSGRLPEGMGKLNINWKTGEIRVPALANEETQGFVKTVSDFTVKAKDTFGSRVTNFELNTFMRRLPTLANSTQGRRLIIAQMKSMSELDNLYYDSMKDVYNNYGLRGIDRQKAEEIAEKRRAPQEELLKQKVADSVSAQEVYELKSKLPEGHVLIEFQGRKGAVSKSQVDAAIEKGARLL